MARLDSILAGALSIKDVGRNLVAAFGTGPSRSLAVNVGFSARQALSQDQEDRVAKAAAKWSRQAKERITDNGWKDPEPPASKWDYGYRESRYNALSYRRDMQFDPLGDAHQRRLRSW